MMDEAAAAGIAYAARCMESDNPDAARLYRRLGFASLGQQGAHVAMTWPAAAD